MRDFHFLTLKNACSFPSPYHPTKLSYEAEIWYVHLVETLNVLFWDLDFSAPFYFLTASNVWLFGRFIVFLEFVPRITFLQIGLGS